MTTALLRASLRGMIRESRWLLDDAMKLLDQIELNERESGDGWLMYPEFEPVNPGADLMDGPRPTDYEHWTDYEEARESFIEEHFKQYLVQIEGATQATMLYFDGDQWFDERGIPYKVVKWMHIPEV